MPLPFLCKAVYFSFLDDKSMVVTSDIKIPRSLIANMEEVQNLSIDTNGVQVSLPIANYDSAYMGTQNCLLLTKDKTDEILVYHITNYKFVGNYMTISASNTPYIINKNEITTDTQYYIINNQIPKDAISTFIEWGYAHDSVCKEDGTLNITASKDSDLYIPCYNGETEIVTYREKLVFDLCDDEDDNKYLSDNIAYWVYVYVEPRKYVVTTTGDSADREKTLYASSYDNMVLPYGILCYPIFKEGVAPFMYFNVNQSEQVDNNSIDNRAFTLFRELNNDTSYIYSLKMSPTPPSPKILYKRVGNKFYIYQGSADVETQYQIFVMGSPTSDISYAFFQVYPNSNKPYETNPILNSTLQLNGYPKGTRTGQRISTEDFKSINNPFISLHTTKLRLKNSTGDYYDYKPLDLGLFYNIKFNYYDPRTIDNTSTYLCVNVDSLTYSNITQDTSTSYNGLLTTNNSDLVYSSDLLSEYLANNKNAYNSFYLRRNLELAYDTSQGLINIGVGLANGNVGQPIRGFSEVGFGVANAVSQTKQFNWQLDNMKSARDKLNYTNNSMYLGCDIMGIGFYVEIVTCRNYIKELVYREFIDRGIYLNKYIKDTDAYKYLSITDNAYDKKNYKFIQASTNLKGNNLHNSKQLIVYRNYLQNGVQLVKTDDIVVSDEATNQDSVLQNLNEEEFN